MRRQKWFTRPLIICALFFVGLMQAGISQAITFDSVMDYKAESPDASGNGAAAATKSADLSNGNLAVTTSASQNSTLAVGSGYIDYSQRVGSSKAEAYTYLVKSFAVSGAGSVSITFSNLSQTTTSSGAYINYLANATSVTYLAHYWVYYPCSIGGGCSPSTYSYGTAPSVTAIAYSSSGYTYSYASGSTQVISLPGVPGTGYVQVYAGVWAISSVSGGPSSATGNISATASTITVP